jgi:FtsZ-binding cell division protein ZapB
MSSDAHQQEQFKIGPFPDLTAFDELERKITAIIKRYQRLQAENAGLKAELQTHKQELEKLQYQNQDNLKYQKKENLVRDKIEALLDKLEKLPSAQVR